MSPHVEMIVQGHVGVITINRPERRNALTLEMRADLSAALDELDADQEIRVAVLQGAAPAFCAGVDLSEAGPTGDNAAKIPSVSAPVAAFSKPIVAAVRGAAAGGGFEIALACDFIVAASDAKFLLPEVRIGSLPGGGGTQRLARSVSPGLAARLLYTGDSLDAATAFSLGLVTEIVDPEKLTDHVVALATRIAANAPLSLRALKQCLRVAANAPLDEALTVERELWRQLSTTDDRAEGRQAFREGRPPRFRGK